MQKILLEIWMFYDAVIQWIFHIFSIFSNMHAPGLPFPLCICNNDFSVKLVAYKLLLKIDIFCDY